MTTVMPVAPHDPDAVALFERYRVHYGQSADREAAAAWLRDNLGRGRLLGFLARVDGAPAGLCLVAPCPASLRLGEFWFVRDLYVDPAHRRHAVARTLLDEVTAAARRRGAIRLSVQTERDNDAALRLYDSVGFTPVTGVRHLLLDLAPRTP